MPRLQYGQNSNRKTNPIESTAVFWLFLLYKNKAYVGVLCVTIVVVHIAHMKSICCVVYVERNRKNNAHTRYWKMIRRDGLKDHKMKAISSTSHHFTSLCIPLLAKHFNLKCDACIRAECDAFAQFCLLVQPAEM